MHQRNVLITGECGSPRGIVFKNSSSRTGLHNVDASDTVSLEETSNCYLLWASPCDLIQPVQWTLHVFSFKFQVLYFALCATSFVQLLMWTLLFFYWSIKVCINSVSNVIPQGKTVIHGLLVNKYYMVVCRYGISLLLFNFKWLFNSLSTRAEHSKTNSMSSRVYGISTIYYSPKGRGTLFYGQKLWIIYIGSLAVLLGQMKPTPVWSFGLRNDIVTF